MSSTPTPASASSTTNLVVITNADLSTVTNASYGVLKSGTNLLVTVVRTNANTGTVSVNYATATNANDTAVAGVDYVATSGLLTFSNGVTLQSFLVPILNNRQIEGNRTFSINLSNPAGGAPGVAQLIPPSTATVTITDDIAGISFSSPYYRVNENGGSATINVLRSNYTNSTVSVNYGTAGLTAIPGVNYSNVNGTLTFNPWRHAQDLLGAGQRRRPAERRHHRLAAALQPGGQCPLRQSPGRHPDDPGNGRQRDRRRRLGPHLRERPGQRRD